MADTPANKVDPYDAAVAARLRAVRRQRGLSQTQAAAGVGVSYQQLQKYETGANRISAGSLHRLAEFFDVPVRVFFAGQDEGMGAGTPADPREMELVASFRGLPSPKLQDCIAGLVQVLNEDAKGSGPPAVTRGRRG